MKNNYSLQLVTNLHVAVVGGESDEYRPSMVTPLGLVNTLAVSGLKSNGCAHFIDVVGGLTNVKFESEHGVDVDGLPAFLEYVKDSIVQFALASDLCFKAMCGEDSLSKLSEFLPRLELELEFELSERHTLVVNVDAVCVVYAARGEEMRCSSNVLADKHGFYGN